jgi:predicted ferric reductase
MTTALEARRVAPARGPVPRPRTAPPAPAAQPASHLAVRAVLVAGALTVVGMWWQHTGAFAVQGPGPALTSFGRITGLLGAYLVLVQLLLMARIPWFERAVGLDRLAAWHRGLGTNTVVLLVVHVLSIVWGYGLTQHHATLAELWTVVTTYPSMMKATAGLLGFLVVAVVSARSVRAKVSYEVWYWLHLTTYLSIALAFFHQVSTGADFLGHPAAKLLWTAFYLGVAGIVLTWRLVLPARGWWRHRLLVERVVTEAPGVVSVHLRGHHLDELGGRAGHFFLWRFVTPGHLWSAHPYSLSAVPNGKHLRITVKDAGDHSADLARLRPGVPVFAEGPFGHFTADGRTRTRALLVAGGSGIGPVRALAEDLARAGDDVTVVYRASTRDDLALAHELDALAGKRFRVHYVVGRRRELGHDPLSAKHLQRLVPDLARREVYVCGPDGMTRAVQRSVTALGVPRRLVHTEEFSLR